jgi:hypothetical protein
MPSKGPEKREQKTQLETAPKLQDAGVLLVFFYQIKSIFLAQKKSITKLLPYYGTTREIPQHSAHVKRSRLRAAKKSDTYLIAYRR